MRINPRKAFTLVEVLIVVVIMAVLAATIIPQFTDSAKDAKESNVKFNLHTLRSQITLYKSQHNGLLPSADLNELTIQTNISGAVGTDYGPYILSIPTNQINGENSVKAIAASPAVAGDVSATDGWLYHAATGGIWISDANLFGE